MLNEIITLKKERKHFPFFDSAYQGFASGDLDRDAYSIRLFADRGKELFIAQSFSKNLGFYGERVGCLTMVVNDNNVVENMRSQMKLVVRAMYSNPPINGARIAGIIFSNEDLFNEWLEELKMMSSRLQNMRKALFDQLVANSTPGDWSHIVKQIGMFAYTGLSGSFFFILLFNNNNNNNNDY